MMSALCLRGCDWFGKIAAVDQSAGLRDLARVNYLIAFAASFTLCNIAGYLLNARFTSVNTPVNFGAQRLITYRQAAG